MNKEISGITRLVLCGLAIAPEYSAWNRDGSVEIPFIWM